MNDKSIAEKYPIEVLKKLLYDMVFMRRFEEKAAQMYGLRKIGGFCHLYIGQEAVGVGSITPLDLTKDYILGAYRIHGLALQCGISANEVMAELFGKRTGCAKGKGGSMHMFDKNKHMLGGNGIVGGQIPVATGVAFKIAYQKEDGVVLCYFGDGAIHQGAFHESLNLAKIWNLPIIYICENNQYGMGTAFHRVSSVTDFSVMGASYNIPGFQVDGMDVLITYDFFKKQIQWVRENQHPVFIEAKTYRYKGHSMSDPAKYRTKEELEAYKQQDPIFIFKDQLLTAGIITEEYFHEIDLECQKIAQASVDFSENSPEPELDELYEDVLA